MTETELYDTTGPQPTRRRALQLLGAGTGAAIVGSGQLPDRIDPAGEASAQWPASGIGTATEVGPTGVGYLTREINNLAVGESIDFSSAEDPALLTQRIYEQLWQMRAADDTVSTVVLNHVEDSRNVAWFRGKTAAIEEMQNEAAIETVKQAALAEVESYYVTFQKNVANHWKEQLNLFQQIVDELDAHDQISGHMDHLCHYDNGCGLANASDDMQLSEHTVTLVDGSEMTLPYHTVADGYIKITDAYATYYSGTDGTSSSFQEYRVLLETHEDSEGRVDTQRYLDIDASAPLTYEDLKTAAEEDSTGDYYTNVAKIPYFNRWLILWDAIEQITDDMLTELELWIDNAYTELQAGEISIEEIVENDPTLLASEWASDYEETGSFSYAMADLTALGVGTDFDSVVTVELDDGAVLDGQLYVSDDSVALDVGTQYNPEDLGAVYMAFETDSWYRPITDYRENVDGGEIQVQFHPHDQMVYTIETGHDESLTLDASDFTEASGSTEDSPVYHYDATDDLETPITTIESITAYYKENVEDTGIHIQQPFTITEAVDPETGEQVETVDFRSYNQQTSDVSLTEEQLQEFIDAREDQGAYDSGVSDDVGAGLPSFGDLSDGAIAGVAVLVGIIVALGSLFN